MIARFNNTAYVVASGLGLALLLVLILGQAGLSFWALFEASKGKTDTTELTSIAVASWASSGLSCVCGSLLNLAIGGLYGGWVGRKGQAADEGAIGGAASAATAQTLGTMIQTGFSLLALPFVMQQTGGQLGSPLDPAILGVSAVTTGIGALFNVCSSALVGGLLGALGGAVGAGLSRRKV